MELLTLVQSLLRFYDCNSSNDPWQKYIFRILNLQMLYLTISNQTSITLKLRKILGNVLYGLNIFDKYFYMIIVMLNFQAMYEFLMVFAKVRIISFMVYAGPCIYNSDTLHL